MPVWERGWGWRGDSGGASHAWLHVGTHKTGTLSIQHALSQRRSELAKRGVPSLQPTNRWAPAHAVLRAELVTVPRLTGLSAPAPDLMGTELAALDLMRGALPSMIISSETFCLLRTAAEASALRAALSDRFDPVLPIVTFRNLGRVRPNGHAGLRCRDGGLRVNPAGFCPGGRPARPVRRAGNLAERLIAEERIS